MSQLYSETEPVLRHGDLHDDHDDSHLDDNDLGGPSSRRHDAAARAHLTRLQERRERPRAASLWTMVKRTLRAAFAECIGTFILAFFTLYATKVAQTLEPNTVDPVRVLFIALIFGCVYGAALYALSYDGVGGKPNVRQLNPAVSLVLFGMGRMKLLDSAIFVAAQIAGAALSVVVAPLCWPDGDALAPIVFLSSTNGQVAASILVGLLFFVVVIFTFFDRTRLNIRQTDHYFTLQASAAAAAAAPHREQRPQSQHETNCLLALAAATATAGVLAPVTYDFANPALSLAFAITLNKWGWVPLAGPYLAALCAIVVGRLCDWQLDHIRAVFSDAGRGAAGAGAGAAGGAINNEGKHARGARRSAAAAAAAAGGGVQMGAVMDHAQMDDL